MSRSVPLAYPGKVISDDSGGLWIADSGHHRVIGVDAGGAVHTIIGSGQRGSADGSLEQAAFDEPQGLVLTADRRALYVADCRAHRVRRVDLAGCSVTTVASTPGAPWGLALDEEAGRLYIAVAGAHQIWRLCLAERTLELVAGTGARAVPRALIDGPCARASFADPSGLCLSSDRRRLYVADRASSAIRVIHLAAAMVETVAGTHFQGCMDVTLSPAGIVVADTESHALRGINPRHGTVVTLWPGQTSGTDQLARPAGVAFDRVDRTYVVADTHNHRIVRVARDASWVRTVELCGLPDPR